jgi:hypothetical protein
VGYGGCAFNGGWPLLGGEWEAVGAGFLERGGNGVVSWWVTLDRWVVGRRAGDGSSQPGRMVTASVRAGVRGCGGVGLGGPRHLVGLKKQVGQNAADGWAGTKEFKRKLNWATKAIGPNSMMVCRNSF